MRLVTATGEVRVGAEGGLTRVEHRDRPATSYLQSWTPRSATVGGVSAGWSETSRTEDDDECEIAYRWRGDRRLRLEVRHAVAPLWTERWVLEVVEPDGSPATTDGLEVEELVVDLQPDPAMVARGCAAGAETWFAVLPPDGAGPVLGARLQSGSVRRIADGRLHTGALRLRPGRRYAFSWLLGWYPTPLAFVQHVNGLLPGGETLAAGEVWDLPDDPNQVVLTPDELTVRTGDRGTEITAPRSGRFRVELRSARGTVLAEVTWAPRLTEVVTARAAELLGLAQTRGGTPRLSDAASAVVVQYALGAGLVDDADLAADALELFVDQLTDGFARGRVELDALSRIAVAREVVQGGDPALLDLPARSDVPGAGLAAAQCALAGIVAGRQPRALVPAGPRAERVLLSPAGVADGELLAQVRAVGTRLGGGLGGRDLHAPPAAEQAYAVVLLGMVPESFGPRLERDWGIGAPALAERATATLLALPDLPAEALAWLCVAEPQRS